MQFASSLLANRKAGCVPPLLLYVLSPKRDSVLSLFLLRQLPLHPRFFLSIAENVPDEAHSALSLSLQISLVRPKQHSVRLPAVLWQTILSA